ncbi:hypothetical protein ACFL3H_08180 [Gemmatimonadota bacterium]
MKEHLEYSTLLEYTQNLLPPGQREQVEDHIIACESCRQTVAETRAVGEKVKVWETIEVPDEYVDAQLRLLEHRLQDLELDPGREQKVVRGRFPLLSRAGIRGAIIAATAVLSTIAVQGLILNPLSMEKEIRTVFEMTPLPLDYPVGGALPDTMIVLNVHADGSYSTSVFEGVYSFEALKTQLAREVNRGDYWTLAVDMSQLRNPFNLRFKDLVFFRKKLGIEEFRLWTDDIATKMSRRNLTLEELEQIVGAGQPRIGVTRDGIDFQPLHQMSCTIGTDGKISLYGRVSTMAEMHNILLNYHTLNPEGKLQIMYWESSLTDSVVVAVRELAEGIGIKAITDSKLRTY